MAGCASLTSQQAEQKVAGQKLQEALTKQTTANQELEGELARLQLLLLEKEAKNKDLDQRLDEAILEVVRAKAKLRSLESKAEAVSTLAEGEIALKALKANVPGMEKDADFLQAEGQDNALARSSRHKNLWPNSLLVLLLRLGAAGHGRERA